MLMAWVLHLKKFFWGVLHFENHSSRIHWTSPSPVYSLKRHQVYPLPHSLDIGSQVTWPLCDVLSQLSEDNLVSLSVLLALEKGTSS